MNFYKGLGEICEANANILQKIFDFNAIGSGR